MKFLIKMLVNIERNNIFIFCRIIFLQNVFDVTAMCVIQLQFCIIPED